MSESSTAENHRLRGRIAECTVESIARRITARSDEHDDVRTAVAARLTPPLQGG